MQEVQTGVGSPQEVHNLDYRDLVRAVRRRKHPGWGTAVAEHIADCVDGDAYLVKFVLRWTLE